MGKTLVSKPDIKSSSGVMYPYVSKKNYQDTQNLQYVKRYALTPPHYLSLLLSRPVIN